MKKRIIPNKDTFHKVGTKMYKPIISLSDHITKHENEFCMKMNFA